MNATAQDAQQRVRTSSSQPIELRPILKQLRAWDHGLNATIGGAVQQLDYLPQKIEEARRLVEVCAWNQKEGLTEQLRALEGQQATLKLELQNDRARRLELRPKVAGLMVRIERLQALKEGGLPAWEAHRSQMTDEQASAVKAATKLEKEHAAQVSEFDALKAGNATRIERLTTAVAALKANLVTAMDDRAKWQADQDAAYTRAIAEGLTDQPTHAASDPDVAAMDANIKQQTSRHTVLVRGLEDTVRSAGQAEQIAAEQLAVKRAQLDQARNVQRRLRWDILAGDLVMQAAAMYGDEQFLTNKFSLPIFDRERVPGGNEATPLGCIDDDALRRLSACMGSTDTAEAIVADLQALGLAIEI